MSSQPPILPEQLVSELQPEGEFHISQWIEVIRRRHRLLVVVAAVVLLAAVVLYAVTPKSFRATTVIQIERRSATLASMGSTIDAADWYDAQNFFPTQYRLLQSRGLAERVVKDLRLAENPAFNPTRGSLLGGGGARPVTAADDEAAVARLARKLLAGEEVNPVRNTRLVEISYDAPAPDLAAQVANGIAEAFIDWGIEMRSSTAGRASSFLASQIEAIKQEIQDKEAQLQAYSRRSDIVALDPASNVTVQRLEGLNKDYVQAVSDRIQKESRYQELSTAPEDVVADTVSGGLVGELRADQLKLERDYATKLNTYKPEWPAMQELKAQIDKGRQHLQSVVDEVVTKARDTAKAEYQSALRREEALADELGKQKAEAMRLNSASVEYNNLKVEVSTRRALLDELLRKQSETEVASRLEGSRDSNVIVVDRALVPGAAYRPSLRRNLLLGLVLGLGLGLGAVFLAEYLDSTLKTPDDVDRILKLPVLAVIPDIAQSHNSYGYRYGGYGYAYGYGRRHRAAHSRKGQATAKPPSSDDVQIELLPQVKPRFAASEAYRTLRTSLLLSTAGGLRSVVLTSAIPGEGKTATATNLAVVMAQLGRDVLLIDADLRRPRLHEIFGVSNRVGLVGCLTGKPDEGLVFLRTSVANLFVVPSGPMPPNPAELLASERMRAFVAMARGRYEFLVFDTPPALPVTDATVLASMCDGVVLCLGASQVLREDARTCRDRLQLAGVRVLGAALNRYRIDRGRYGKQYRKQYRSYEAYDQASSGEQPRA